MLQRLPIIRHLRARPRLASSIVFGLLIWLALPGVANFIPMTRLLLAWNMVIGLYLALVAVMAQADTATIRTRSAQEDEGNFLILGLTVATAIASLVAIIAELSVAKSMHGAAQGLHIGLVALTVVLSWSFMQVMFALHYAHSYYGAGADPGHPALEFPGRAEPGYWDFAYFSLIIGTSAQTADVSIADPLLRRIATLHCIVVFFFNTTILALMVNISASLI